MVTQVFAETMLLKALKIMEERSPTHEAYESSLLLAAQVKATLELTETLQQMLAEIRGGITTLGGVSVGP